MKWFATLVAMRTRQQAQIMIFLLFTILISIVQLIYAYKRAQIKIILMQPCKTGKI